MRNEEKKKKKKRKEKKKKKNEGNMLKTKESRLCYTYGDLVIN